MQALVDIRDTIQSMKPTLEQVGIKYSSIEKLIILLMKVDNEEQLLEFLNWLKTIRDGPVKEYNDIYKLKPPEWWDNMVAFGINHTREFRLLAAAKKKLRAAWRTKYGEGKSGEGDSDSEDSDKLQIQPSDTRPDEGNC